MIGALNIAKTGMDTQQKKLDVIANNLANSGTVGFKRSTAHFSDLIYQNMLTAQIGTGAKLTDVQKTFTQGTLSLTENPTDMAINGRGFFQVQTVSGEIAYSRNGSFRINNQNQMTDIAGNLVVPNISIPQGSSDLAIDKQGVVTVKDTAGQVIQLGQMTIANFVNENGLQATGENLYKETAESGPPLIGNPGADGAGTIQQYSLEASNVNVANELVQMIEAQRAYELNSKAIQAADQMLQKLSNL